MYVNRWRVSESNKIIPTSGHCKIVHPDESEILLLGLSHIHPTPNNIVLGREYVKAQLHLSSAHRLTGWRGVVRFSWPLLWWPAYADVLLEVVHGLVLEDAMGLSRAVAADVGASMTF